MLELNRLYNMDCMEGMKGFPDKFFDLAIVDPPYGVNYGKSGKLGSGRVAKSNNYKPTTWDSKPPDINYFNELNRISRDQIIWGCNHYTDRINLKSGRIIWDKLLPFDEISGMELAYNSCSNGISVFKYLWHGMLQENMKNKEIRTHPTQKPANLYRWILRRYAKPDYKIIDTHAGSCSSVIAFLDFGCQWIAFEIDKDYYEVANKRIENHKAQLKLSL